jgi:hypothetical protein
VEKFDSRLEPRIWEESMLEGSPRQLGAIDWSQFAGTVNAGTLARVRDLLVREGYLRADDPDPKETIVPPSTCTNHPPSVPPSTCTTHPPSVPPSTCTTHPAGCAWLCKQVNHCK